MGDSFARHVLRDNLLSGTICAAGRTVIDLKQERTGDVNRTTPIDAYGPMGKREKAGSKAKTRKSLSKGKKEGKEKGKEKNKYKVVFRTFCSSVRFCLFHELRKDTVGFGRVGFFLALGAVFSGGKGAGESGGGLRLTAA